MPGPGRFVRDGVGQGTGDRMAWGETGETEGRAEDHNGRHAELILVLLSRKAGGKVDGGMEAAGSGEACPVKALVCVSVCREAHQYPDAERSGGENRTYCLW
jgi:hypothetical protein